MDEGNRKEDELEHIVREAAEKAQYGFDPKAWSAMEQKLNDADRTPFAWWKVLFPIGVIAIVLLLIFWPNGGEVSSETKEPTTTEIQSEEKAPEGKEPIQSATSTTEEEQAVSAEAERIEKEELTAGMQSTRESAPEATGKSSETSKTNQKLVQNSTHARDNNPRQIAQENSSSIANGNNAQESLLMGSDKFLIKKAEAPLWMSGPIKFSGTPGMLIRRDSFGVVEEVQEPLRKRKGGAWNFLVSGDLSGANVAGFSKPGTMFGVMRESYIGKYWSFSFGAAYSVKKYTALGADYETPYWARNDPDAIESILANCLVIDIPFNVRRYFDTKNGNQFFISSGISSYLMLREDYDYIYNEDKPGWTNSWSIRNENKHFFGIVNFSVGFERRLNDNLALGIEPFVKLPLSGVGFGKVELLSFGVNLALKLDK